MAGGTQTCCDESTDHRVHYYETWASSSAARLELKHEKGSDTKRHLLADHDEGVRDSTEGIHIGLRGGRENSQNNKQLEAVQVESTGRNCLLYTTYAQNTGTDTDMDIAMDPDTNTDTSIDTHTTRSGS